MPFRALNRRQRKAIYRLIRAELLPLARKRFPGLRADVAELRARLALGKTLTVASGGKTVGFIHLIERKPAVWIDMLAVDRAHQGKGLGTRLLRRAERHAAAAGAKAMKLLVDAGNITAIRFYAQNGFAGIGYHPGLHCYEYVKSLDPMKKLPAG